MSTAFSWLTLGSEHVSDFRTPDFATQVTPRECRINASPIVSFEGSRMIWNAYRTAVLRVMHQASCCNTLPQCSQTACMLDGLLWCHVVELVFGIYLPRGLYHHDCEGGWRGIAIPVALIHHLDGWAGGWGTGEFT